MLSVKTIGIINPANSIQQSDIESLAAVSLRELIVRRDKAAADAAIHQRIIDRETLGQLSIIKPGINLATRKHT